MTDYENQNPSEYRNDGQPQPDNGQENTNQNSYGNQQTSGNQNPYGNQPANGNQNPYGNQPANGNQNPYGSQPDNGNQNPYGSQTMNGNPDPWNSQAPVPNEPRWNSQPPYNNQATNGGPYYNQPQNNNQYYNQPPYGQPQNNWNNSPYGNQKPPKQKNSFATTALITGIFGILTLCCCAFPLAIIMGVGAISFAIISKRGQPFTGFAIAGIVLGVISIVGGVVEFIYVMAISSLMRDPEYAAMFNQIYEQMQQQLQSGQ